MNKAETAKLVATIQEVYPRFLDGRTAARTVEIWQQFFEEPYAVVSAAVVAFISSDTKGFAPNVGQIKERIALMRDDEPDETQAWSLVCRALARGDREAYAKLPPLIQGCIGDYGTFYEWSMEELGTVNTVTKASFLRTYRARAERQREYGKLPGFARSQYKAIAAPEPYRLPPPEAEKEWDGEQAAAPESVMGIAQRIKADLASSPRALQDLKDQGRRNEAMPGVTEALLKGQNNGQNVAE